MKIWLDASFSRSEPGSSSVLDTVHQAKNGDCECECTPTRTYSAVARRAFSHNLRLRLAASCQIQICADSCWLICNPLSMGYVAVVDDEARRLLECFRLPKTLDEVIGLYAGISPSLLARAVTVFWELGLFQDTHTLVSSSAQSGQETLIAWLHVTNACNLHCQYCYVRKSSERMSEDTSLRAVDAIFRSARQDGYKRVKIKYAGGEASLEMRHVLAIHDYAAQQAQNDAMQFHGLLLSNGVALTGHMIEQLKMRAIDVSISLDGSAAYHDAQRPFTNGRGSFAFVDRSIQRLLAHQLVPSISVTITRRNLAGLPELITYIMQKDLPFTLNLYRDNENAHDREQMIFQEREMIEGLREAFRVVEQFLPRHSLLGALLDRTSAQGPHAHACGVGRNYLVINQRGGIAKCHAAQQQEITTVRASHPLRVIQNSPEGPLSIPVEEKQGCKTCNWRFWCTGGCPLLTKQVTGRYDVQSPNCHIYQALFPDVLRLEALRLLQHETLLDLAEVRC